MLKQTWAFIILFVLAGVQIPAIDFDPGAYGSIVDYLEGIYGVDSNAGLTTLPVLNVPMGGRAEGMATAFAAVSDDITFLEYNPAGSSMLSHGELAFFHNNWIADTKLEGVAFAHRYKNLGYGAGGKWLYTPFTEYNMYGERASKGYYSEAVAAFNISYNFFSGYYFSGLSLGANLKTAFRLVPDYSDDAGSIISGSGRSQSGVGFMGDIGALTRFNLFKLYSSRDQNAAAALVIRNIGPPIKGEALPTVAVAAISYRPIRPLLFAFDFSVPLNLTNVGVSEKPYGALGIGLDLTRFLSLRTGLLVKPASFRLALGSAITLDRVALEVNYTLDMTTQFRPLNRVSVGVRFNLGDQGRKARADQVDALYLSGLESYAAGNYEEARHYWEEALVLNPRFEPAKEGLEIIRGTQDLESRINELEQLNL
jgi:tetratricopeptide (TPR) repeat protein